MKMEFLILSGVPVSGSVVEKHFGRSFQKSVWIEFCTDTNEKWVACFAKGNSHYNTVLLNASGSRALVVAGGQGYFIDLHLREEVFTIEDYPSIDSALYTGQSDVFLYSNFLCIYMIRKNSEHLQIEPNFNVDGIFLLEAKENKVSGHLYSYSMCRDHNIGFELDLKTKMIRRNVSLLYDCKTHERIEETKKADRFMDTFIRLFRRDRSIV